MAHDCDEMLFLFRWTHCGLLDISYSVTNNSWDYKPQASLLLPCDSSVWSVVNYEFSLQIGPNYVIHEQLGLDTPTWYYPSFSFRVPIRYDYNTWSFSGIGASNSS